MTIYDIAEKAGVSASTVSRVINNKPGIKAATRDKVQKLLKEYNYTPDENARGLVNKATKLIGILMADIRNSHHSELAYVVEKKLREYGYCSLILNAGYEPKMMAESIRILEQRKVDGIMLVGSAFQNDIVEKELRERMSDKPVVMANGYLDLPNAYGILVDERDGIRQSVDLLYSKGKRKIAFIVNLGTPSSYEKLHGYEDGLAKHGLSEEKMIIEVPETTIESGFIGARELVGKHPEVDAVICAEDLMALGVIRILNELNIKIPTQMAVVGVNNSVYGEVSFPSITTLDNKMSETGLMAAQILVDCLSGEEKPHKIMLFSTLVERETT
ncbi:LacI family DNA-binding transcriptional regulator [Anaerobium acetethylicum]|uniref:LacI family transcriptional regulator n=1 Tax=Anaerobium acetethylicum TaxID=1619234 RepID=A0A1D3TYE0_9FIRM|nr:LacI family DNA-binding transcriptional regulator [Anaerobium acetethylicum]SCP99437.1 LacI family transcriptional regulator [Anaerobium acetethylicum]